MKNLLPILLILIAFTACSNDEASEPLTFSEHNQRCLEGKIKGQFLIQLSNGKHDVISASSEEDFHNKAFSPEYTELLQKRNLRITAVDFNFKVFAKTRMAPPTTEATDPNLGPRLLNAPYLWSQGFLGQDSKVALIDSGYDVSHPLLKHSVSHIQGEEMGFDFINNKPLTEDLGGHGTRVGSIIAASHSDSYQFSMAPETIMIPIAALRPIDEGETDASGDSNSVLSAMDYAIERDVDFINASWAGDICSKFIREKVKTATDNGIIFVTSAGNENVNIDTTPVFPGSFPFSLLANIGALNPDLSKQADSNFGAEVDFSALGYNVVVAAPHGLYDRASGTSIATPFITGGLALLKSAFPSASPEALLGAMEKSKNSQKLPDLKRAFLNLKKP